MKQKLRIGISGDIMPHDSPIMSGQGVYSTSNGNYSPLFSSLQNYSNNFDFLVGNFEGVLVDKIEKVSPSTSAMKTPLSIIPILKKCKFKYLSIANNHSMEYGPQAFDWMCKQFEASGLITFGHKNRPCKFEGDGNHLPKTGFFAFSTVPATYGFEPKYYFVDRNSSSDIDSLLIYIKKAKAECDHLLVLAHWGNEFMTSPAPWQITLAKIMIENGADGIFGAHSHTIQPAILIKNKPVYFCLGNLISDYFQEQFKRNVIVSLVLSKKKIVSSARIFSCNNNFYLKDTGDKLFLLNSIENNKTEDQYHKETNIIRKKVQKQLIFHLLKYPYRWVFNKGLWIWLISRSIYLIVNRKKIKDNPDKIYSGPLH